MTFKTLIRHIDASLELLLNMIEFCMFKLGEKVL